MKLPLNSREPQKTDQRKLMIQQSTNLLLVILPLLDGDDQPQLIGMQSDAHTRHVQQQPATILIVIPSHHHHELPVELRVALDALCHDNVALAKVLPMAARLLVPALLPVHALAGSRAV